MQPIYKIVEVNSEDEKLSKIEKTYTHNVQFTLQQIEDHVAALEKADKELLAKIEIENAKKKNVEEHHVFVTEMPKEQLATCKIYFDALASIEMHQTKRNEVVELLNQYSAEKVEILKQIKPNEESKGDNQ
jgi:energy-coupling factor transporter ATP-binding protein EcfA2